MPFGGEVKGVSGLEGAGKMGLVRDGCGVKVVEEG